MKNGDDIRGTKYIVYQRFSFLCSFSFLCFDFKQIITLTTNFSKVWNVNFIVDMLNDYYPFLLYSPLFAVDISTICLILKQNNKSNPPQRL